MKSFARLFFRKAAYPCLEDSMIKFRDTGRSGRKPEFVGRAWVMYPCIEGDHMVVGPHESVLISCGVAVEIDAGMRMMVCGCSGGLCGMIVHSCFFGDGDEVVLRVTNAFDEACVIFGDGFDFAGRTGHGIYRGARVVSVSEACAEGYVISVRGPDEFSFEGGSGDIRRCRHEE